MRSASVAESKCQSPPARANNIAIGLMETATNPASRVFTGVLGTIAANISTTAPIQEMIGAVLLCSGIRAQ